MLYTNIHTHREEDPDSIAILNLYSDVSKMADHQFVSIGIHPWHISKTDVAGQLESIRANAHHPHVKAIGECGLDRLTDTPLPEQKRIFMDQIRIAEAVNKPLIIHCVKAFDELIHIKKEQKVKVPLIVHGYNNNAIIAKKLLQHDFYLSFGKALLVENSNAQQFIKTIPATSFFLETDDAAVSIKAIFEAAATLRNTDVETLQNQLMTNFKHLFTYE